MINRSLAVEHERLQLFNMVERVYAQALLELAEQQGVIAPVAQELDTLAHLLYDQPDVIRILASRTLSYDQRDESCRKFFADRVSDLLLRFLRLLVRKNRFDELPGIAAAFLYLYDERHGDIEVQTYTVAPLDETSKQRVLDRIGELTGRRARLVEHLQAQLGGGLKMRVRDALVDGSIATQLRLIRENLTVRGRETARTKLATFLHD